MKLNFKYYNSDNKLKEFSLLLPTSFVKSRFLWKLIAKEKSKAYFFDTYYPFIKKIYKSLKEYIRIHCHFTFFEIESDDINIEISF